MSRAPMILDADGNPLRRQASAHDAGNSYSRALAHWNPLAGSADSDLLPELSQIVARSRDITRNHGFTSGVMQTHLDNVVGAQLRLSAKPDYRVLGITAEAASEWARDTEAKFRNYAEDPGFWCDAQRRTTLSGIIGRSYRAILLNGGSLNIAYWKKRGGAYATMIQSVEIDRLSNPNGAPDTPNLRGGVELGEYGEEIAYHIRKAHPGEMYGLMGVNNFEWERIPRETSWGRTNVIHSFDPERIGQSRGKPLLAPIIEKMKMLDHYERTELQAAIVNAMFAAFITSPYDAEMVSQSLGFDANNLSAYQKQRAEFHSERNLRLDGVRIPHLFPGEKFEAMAHTRPNEAFAAFEEATLRNIAAGANLTYEQVSRDYSKTNYSSARAAMLESWKFFAGRRQFLSQHIGAPIYALWMEEAIDRGHVVLPPGAPGFYDAKAAWTRCKWIGPSMGWIDPLKEADAVGRRLELGITTLESECAATGEDWEDVLDQQAREKQRREDLGLLPAGAAPADRKYTTDQETRV
jgi:lambda family phage portal protein